jgi:hypothetical protein
MNDADRRTDARLRLAYPIRIQEGGDAAGRVLGRTVTRNLSARGTYFSTFDGPRYRVGQTLDVAISVPHRLAGGGREVILDLRGQGRVVRVDAPGSPRMYGEDGFALTGVAVAFTDPLRFQYGWV